MRKHLAVLALLASSSLLIAACAMPADDPNFNADAGVGGDPSANAAAAQKASDALSAALAAPTSIGVDTPLAATPAKDAVIISLTDGSAFEGVTEKAMATAAKSLGWSVSSVTVDPADSAAVATAFSDAVAAKPAGIHIRGELVDALSTELAAAESAGIPVVCTGCSGDPTGAIKDTSIDGTVQNMVWADAMAAYVANSQYAGESAGVQIFNLPGGAISDFNTEFDTALVEKCRECSTMASMVDPMTIDLTDPAAVAGFVSSEMTTSMGAWTLLDSGLLSGGVADALAGDPTLLSPVVLIGRGATAADIAALQSLGGAAPAESSSAAPTDGTASAAASEGRTLEQAAALQAWTAISYPVMGWRIIDQFARILGGEALSEGPLPSQLLTGGNAQDAVLDESGDFIGISDYQAQFLALWGVK